MSLRGPSTKTSSSLVDFGVYSSQIVKLEAELAAKDAAIIQLRTTFRTQRESMEGVVRDLVEKNRRLEEEGRSRLRNADDEFEEVVNENARIGATLQETQRNLFQTQEALHLAEDQIKESKSMQQQLIQENESLIQQHSVLEHEIEQFRENANLNYQIQENFKSDLENALAKLQLADVHIKHLCDEAAESSIKKLQIENTVEEALEEKNNALQNQRELQLRMGRAIYALAEETNELTLDCDELSIRTRIALSGDLEKSLFQEQLRSVSEKRKKFKEENVHVLRCLPSGVKSLTDFLDGNESTITSTTINIVDAIALARDDLSLTLHSIEEVLQQTSVSRHFSALQESVDAERLHTQTLLRQLTAAESTIKAQHEENQKLQNTLKTMDNMMCEVTKYSEESAQRLEAVIKEKHHTKDEVNHVRNTFDALNARVEKQNATILEMQGEIDMWKWSTHQRETDVSLAKEETKRVKEQLRETQMELESANKLIRETKNEISEANRRYHKLETEVSHLQNAVKESDVRRNELQHKLVITEEKNIELKEQAFKSQKVLDSVMRRATTPIRNSSVAQQLFSPQFNRSSPDKNTIVNNDKVSQWESKLNDLLKKAHSNRVSDISV